MAGIDRWLHYTVTTVDRFHCNNFSTHTARSVLSVSDLCSDTLSSTSLELCTDGSGLSDTWFI